MTSPNITFTLQASFAAPRSREHKRDVIAEDTSIFDGRRECGNVI